MNFRPRQTEAPEINLIPFIDVLLVVLIFLMLSTTYSKFTELQLKLPVADADAQRDYPKEVIVTVSSEGAYTVNRVTVPGRSPEEVGAALLQAAKAGKDSVVIIRSPFAAPRRGGPRASCQCRQVQVAPLRHRPRQPPARASPAA